MQNVTSWMVENENQAGQGNQLIIASQWTAAKADVVDLLNMGIIISVSLPRISTVHLHPFKINFTSKS